MEELCYSGLNRLTSTHTPMGEFGLSQLVTPWEEARERTHTNMERTCNLHTERRQVPPTLN